MTSQRVEVLERVDAVAGVIERHSSWAEQHCRLHQEAYDALVAAGVPRLFLPTSLGGLEVDPVTCALACERLANADTAAAWHVMVFNVARLMAAQWPLELVEMLWGSDPDTLVAASGHTPLQAIKSGDGYVINGRQRFVSGCDHASWLLSPVMIGEVAGMAVMPLAECKIEQNWDTLGMRGSGSSDVWVNELTVPGMQVVIPEPQSSANCHYQGILYRCPSRVVFATYVPVALSLAARSLDLVTAMVGDKTPGGSAGKVRERNIAQLHYGKALATFRSARLLFFQALEDTWARAQSRCDASPEDRADLYLAGTHAVQASSEVVRHVADIAATTMITKGQTLERIGRDMETLRHHGFVNESRYASVAQVHWGAELDYPQLLR
ncbi:MAG: acyl-CoA dehydrogenase family protein [Pseudomonadota bacterium]|nr:acyl-CoA dehydrogenase family protein [Pseudomonadota bacterium]MEC8697125.1 acyl-CoA dehydrogenase family protein [Pseudomonadota bacterium]